jgi:hypothetical protein
LTERINFSNLIGSTKDPHALGTMFCGAASHRAKLIQNVSNSRNAFIYYWSPSGDEVTNDPTPDDRDMSEGSVLRPGESVELDAPHWLAGERDAAIFID